MALADVCEEIAAILVAWPERAGSWVDYELACARAHEERVALAERLRMEQEETGGDPLLGALARARERVTAAETQRRLLLAYAERFVSGSLDVVELGRASGVDAAVPSYDSSDVTAVAERLGRAPVS